MPETEPMSLDDPMQQLAEAIGGLELAPLQTPIEQMCFAAGFEAGRKRAGTWRRIAAMIALSAGATIAWDHRATPTSHAPNYAERITDSKASTSPIAERTFSPVITAANLRLRQAVLSNGWDALPASAGEETAPPRPLQSMPSDPHLPRT
jgi:hypothetical protein